MNDEAPMIEIPVVVKNGKVEFLYGVLPKLREETVGRLFIPDHGFQNPKDVEQFLLTGEVELLPAKTTLRAPMKLRLGSALNDVRDEEIILEEPLELTFRGTKKPVLKDCRCTLPSLKTKARSLNEAYTKLSEKYEPHRRGHGGNVFQKVFYLPKGQHQWQPLDELRLAKQIEFQKKLFSPPPEKINLVKGPAS
jgi:hypothetical protein